MNVSGWIFRDFNNSLQRFIFSTELASRFYFFSFSDKWEIEQQTMWVSEIQVSNGNRKRILINVEKTKKCYLFKLLITQSPPTFNPTVSSQIVSVL